MKDAQRLFQFEVIADLHPFLQAQSQLVVDGTLECTEQARGDGKSYTGVLPDLKPERSRDA